MIESCRHISINNDRRSSIPIVGGGPVRTDADHWRAEMRRITLHHAARYNAQIDADATDETETIGLVAHIAVRWLALAQCGRVDVVL
jgi:hypothetical protein